MCKHGLQAYKPGIVPGVGPQREKVSCAISMCLWFSQGDRYMKSIDVSSEEQSKERVLFWEVCEGGEN